MREKYTIPESKVPLAKRMAWLAYKASELVGLGFLQALDNATEDDVWRVAVVASFDDSVRWDYCFGRMMKLSIGYDREKDRMVIFGPPFHPEYQSFHHKYPTKEALIDAAKESLRETTT